MMRASLMSVGAALWIVAAVVRSPVARSEEEDWTAKAREAWSGTCSKCHTVPDATYDTGRAFLAQITETS